MKQLLISQIQPESTCIMLVLVELETLTSCIFLSEDKIRVNPKVKEEMVRLRSKCKLVPCVLDLTAVSYTNTLKILFHNVRSLHLHISDISRDCDVQATDISIFVEAALYA